MQDTLSSLLNHASRAPHLALALTVLTGLAGAQSTWYVDDDAPGDPGPGNPFISDPLESGSSANPFDLIQEAINSAASGDTVLVSPGLYFELDTLDLSSTVGGGVKALTIASEAGPAATTIDLSSAASLQRSGISAVQGESAATVLDGFTIANGDRGSAANENGGALLISSSSPTIRNCWFENNHAYQGGAVITVGSSSPLFEDCVFSNNTAEHQGGGAATTGGGDPRFVRCTFDGNTANYGGGFLARTTLTSSVLVEECVFLANASLVGYGGGLAKFDNGTISILRTRFLSNTATIDGGGALINGPGTIENSTFNTNTAGASIGGGLMITNGSTVSVRGSTFVNNSGGGLSEGTAITFATTVNCTLWDNFPSQLSGFVGVSHCDVMGGYVGAGNLDITPLFKDAWGSDGVRGTLDDDLSLRGISPCIDAGDTTAVATPYPVDFAGYPRAVDHPKVADTGIAVVGQAVDMGAFERQPVLPACNRVVNLQQKP